MIRYGLRKRGSSEGDALMHGFRRQKANDDDEQQREVPDDKNQKRSGDLKS